MVISDMFKFDKQLIIQNISTLFLQYKIVVFFFYLLNIKEQKLQNFLHKNASVAEHRIAKGPEGRTFRVFCYSAECYRVCVLLH